MPKVKRVKIKKVASAVSNLEKIRHSASHVLAAAVLQLFPKAQFGIGPVIEGGFYYDFILPRPLAPDDLPIIEKKMQEIINRKLAFKKRIVSREVALRWAKEKNQSFKEELIKELRAGEQISFYDLGNIFTDLCRGPHVENTAAIRSFKLLRVSGAYWKGDEKRSQMQRVYGTAFEEKSALENYLKLLEEAEKRDHKKLGRELELFLFHETAPGMPYWLPKGLVIYNTLIDFWRKEHQKRGYLEIASPLLNKKELYEISGHWDHYREHMFLSETAEKEIYALKPMNCPNAMVVFALRNRSYRELPLRFSDTDILHRFELSGVLNGLLRVRKFAQDDAHIFVSEDQIKPEYQRILEIAERFYSIFNMEYSFRLGTRPKKFMGDIASWNKAEKDLKAILKASKKKFEVLEGDGAFYGPKIDILMKDALGREWQLGTIQLDFQIPRRFGLKYTDAKGLEKTPVVIHRVIYGSLERFIGLLIEHYAGAFPLWISPLQVIVLPIADRHFDYAKKIAAALEAQDIRVEANLKSETLGAKIRAAEMQKIPYILVVGDKEMAAKTVAVRSREKGDEGQHKLEKLIKRLKEEIEKKK